MKNKILIFLAAAALLVPGYRLLADPATAKAELNELVSSINAKLQSGKRTEADLADNLKQFDVLLAKHKGETNEDVAQILYMKATLYMQVLHDDTNAIASMKQLQHDFPGTLQADRAERMLVGLSLVVNSKFPDFDEKDVYGKPLSIANYKGKVVMVDFWATWCGPCVGEVPNVVKVYQKYHDKGFEIIGISLDRADAKDKMIAFTKEHDMPWQQYYDGQYWTNKLAVKYGVNSIPATFLLDGNGVIVAKNARGEELDPAVAKALGVK